MLCVQLVWLVSLSYGKTSPKSLSTRTQDTLTRGRVGEGSQAALCQLQIRVCLSTPGQHRLFWFASSTSTSHSPPRLCFESSTDPSDHLAQTLFVFASTVNRLPQPPPPSLGSRHGRRHSRHLRQEEPDDPQGPGHPATAHPADWNPRDRRLGDSETVLDPGGHDKNSRWCSTAPARGCSPWPFCSRFSWREKVRTCWFMLFNISQNNR